MSFEYKRQNDRLQMSMFSVVYRYSRGFIIEPSEQVEILRINTEWGKLKDNKWEHIFRDEYINEVNITLDGVIPVSSDYCMPSYRFKFRKSVEGDKIYFDSKLFIKECDLFTKKVMKKSGFKYKDNFEYFK